MGRHSFFRLSRATVPDGKRGIIAAVRDPERGNRFEVAQAMGCERGYYYRVRKVNGRVVREYVGAGEVAELVAQMDALEREQRRLEVLEKRHEKNELKPLDAELEDMNERTDLAARVALLAAGFHLHKRGEWRRRREQVHGTSSSRPEEA
jgi:hypothetical protein